MSSIRQEVLRAALSVVPQWFESQDPQLPVVAVPDCGEALSYRSHRPPTPQLRQLLGHVERQWPRWTDSAGTLMTPTKRRKIQEDVAVAWLGARCPAIDWEALLAYLEELAARTYENTRVGLHLVLSAQDAGASPRIVEPSLQKVLDPLASSQQVYLHVNHRLQFLDFREIRFGEIQDSGSYKFCPEFLQPYRSVLDEGDCFVLLSRRGDLIFVDQHGLLAAQRNDRWYVYDNHTMKNCLSDAVIRGHNYWTGANLFEVVFDLSYRRHGALLVFDPEHKVIDHVVNTGSVLAPPDRRDEVRQMLGPAVKKIRMAAKKAGERHKRLLLDIAHVDGAVIFDEQEVLAFGAMIATHPSAAGHFGARTTAAHSALYHGGTAIKISADGDICAVFPDSDGRGLSMTFA